MADKHKQVYIISDIHMGGDKNFKTSDGVTVDFRIFTHSAGLSDFIKNLPGLEVPRSNVELVLNGDFIDFLAEANSKPPTWTAFKTPEAVAVDAFNRIRERPEEKVVFQEMANLIADGGRITVLVGNHDVELCWPALSEAFARALNTTLGDRFQVLDKQDCYRIDNAVIEHGNQYDIWNNTDPKPNGQDKYDPCAGSELVAEVMNPIKAQYPFIDLLKPEDQAAIPVLLALDPKAVAELPEVLELYLKALGHRVGLWEAKRSFAETKAKRTTPDGVEELKKRALESMVEDLVEKEFRTDKGPWDLQEKRAMGFIENALKSEALPKGSKMKLEAMKPPSAIETFSYPGAGAVRALKSWLYGLMDDVSLALNSRYPLLLLALRRLQGNNSFNICVETDKDYLDAARERISQGAKYSIMGHSHLAKDVDLGNGARYLNTGAWADLMRIPQVIVEGPLEDALEELTRFMENLGPGKVDEWKEFDPHHVRLDLNRENKIIGANLL